MKYTNRLNLSILVSLVLTTVLLLAKQVNAVPQTFVVTNTNASGAGSFAQAIDDANGNGNPADQDVIEFNIAGAGTQTIPLSHFDITEPVFIDGYTQSDAQANTVAWPDAMNGILRIELDGSATGTSGTSVIEVQSDNVTIKGLVINQTNDTAVQIVSGADDVAIQGNYIGVLTDGTTRASGSFGVSSALIVNAADGTIIGGQDPEERNVMTDNRYPIVMAESTNTVIQGNNLNVGADGTSNIADVNSRSGVAMSDTTGTIVGGSAEGEGNFLVNSADWPGVLTGNDSNLLIAGNDIQDNIRGIQLDGTQGATIGGNTSEARNIISNNGDLGGVNVVGSSDITLENNYIGQLADGTTAAANNARGIYIYNSSSVTVGAAGFGNSVVNSQGNGIEIEDSTEVSVVDNEISDNQGDGVQVKGTSEDVVIGGTSVGNIITGNSDKGINLAFGAPMASILGNSIIDNTNGLGIDLNSDGVSTPDSGDPDAGANNTLNFPEDVLYEEVGGDTEMSYTLDVPAGDYRIEFFSNAAADSSGYGEGETLLDTQNITSAGAGSEPFTHTLTGTGYANISMTATLVDVGAVYGFGPTSEFSATAEEDVPPPDPDPVADLSLTKTLNNPEDYQPGETLNFTFTITNNGPDNIDLADYDGTSNPNETALLIDYLPPGMTFDSISTPNVSCSAIPGTLNQFAPVYRDHSEYTGLLCTHDPDESTMLNSGDSFDIDMSVTLAGDADLNYYNYAIVGMQYDPEEEVEPIADCPAPIFSDPEAPDLIDCTINSGFDNFAVSAAPTDVAITADLQNDPSEFYPGNNVTYQVALQNNGPGDINPIFYPINPGNSLVATIIYDASKLTPTGNSPNVLCNDVGPGSIAFVGAAGSDHPNHQLIICGTNVGSQIISSGEQFEFSLNFAVNNNVQPGEDVTNYFAHTSTLADPDSIVMGGALFTATEDILDTYNDTNNYFRLSSTGVAAPSGSSAKQDDENNGLLGSTGQNEGVLILLAVTLLFVGGTTVVVRKRA